MDEIKQYWNRALKILEEESSSPVSFETWILPIVPYKIEENSFILKIKDDFYRDMIQKRYLSLIRSAIKTATKTDYKIKMITNAELPKEPLSIPENNITATTEMTSVDSNLNPRYIFSSFVVGNSNRMAHAASLAVAEAPAEAYNPLFLYGNSGLGKTHLMHSIAHYILDKNPSTKVLYVTSETFMNEFITAIQNNKNEEFRNKYRNIDVLLIDDIQFIAGKEKIQEEFFHTFNNLYNDSKQIIVSSDRSPEDLKVLEDRLRTRFCWGLQVDISPPDFALKVAIIKKKIKGEKINISDDIISYIASNIGNDVRQLEGSITRLVAYSVIMCEQNITIEFAMEALKDFTKKPVTDQNNIRRIQKTVANFYKISFDDIKSKKRTPSLAIPRQVAMYLCRKLTDESFERIGIEFAGKNHATVIHACNKIDNEIKSNKVLKDAIDDIVKQLT